MDRHASRPANLAAVMVFVAMLLAPLVLALTGHAGFDTDFIVKMENRRPFVAPPISSGALATGGWERDAEREIADAFPLRRRLIETYDTVKYAWLQDSTSVNVIRGRDGWLFYGAEERDYLDGTHPPSDADLARVADIYAARAAWCARHGVRYVFLLAPNKSTIYANELPSGIRLVTPTPADRLVPMLRARGVPTIDVRGALRDAARAGDVYSRGDTHWNDAGAYVAYRATIDALRDAGVRDAIPAGAIRSHAEPGPGDLLSMSGVAGWVNNAWVRYDFPHRAIALTLSQAGVDPPLGLSPEGGTTVAGALPRAVVFGDSFMEALRPYFGETFGRVVYLRYAAATGQQFDERIVSAEHPRVVIQELVERSLVSGKDFLR